LAKFSRNHSSLTSKTETSLGPSGLDLFSRSFPILSLSQYFTSVQKVNLATFFSGQHHTMDPISIASAVILGIKALNTTFEICMKLYEGRKQKKLAKNGKQPLKATELGEMLHSVEKVLNGQGMDEFLQQLGHVVQGNEQSRNTPCESTYAMLIQYS
jgi:hypothetical protein